MPMTISTRQFRTIMRIVASPDDPDCVEPLPWSILRSLHELIRCDSVVFTMFDARRHEIILGQDVGEPADVPDDQWTGLHRAFWTHYWDSPQCCYPDVSGDVATVTTASDFYSDRQLHSTAMYSEYLRHIDGEREMMLCLPSEPGRVLRLLFWRGPGLDFTQRDRDLLTVLRPHLYAAFLAQKRRHESAPSLTHASSSCYGWWPPATPTARSRAGCRSRRRPCENTSNTSSPGCGSTAGRRRSPEPSAPRTVDLQGLAIRGCANSDRAGAGMTLRYTELGTC